MTNQKALLNPTPPSNELERVNAVFGMAEEMLGSVPAGLRLYGISPPLLETFAGNVSYFRNDTKLSPELTTMIRYLVSEKAGCQFCIDMNEGFMTSMGADIDTVRAARDDLDKAPVSDREKTLLGIALQSVSDPDQINASDIDAAHDAGWGDREIFDAVVQAASNRAFNYVLKTFNIETQEAFA